MGELPERVTIYEVGPRDGLQNEDGHGAHRRQGRVHAPPAGRRPAGGRGDQLRAPEVGAAAGRRRGAAGPAGRRAGRAACGYPVLVPNERGLDRALELGVPPRRDLRQRHRDLRPAQPQPHASTSSSRCSRRPCTRARDAGLDVRAYVVDVLRRPVGGRRCRSRRWSTSAGGCFDLGCQPALARRHHRRRHRRSRRRAARRAFNDAGLADESLAVHFHDTYGQALANTLRRAAARHHHRRRHRRRPRRLPLRRERHRQPGHRGPRLDAARPRDRDRRRPRRARRDQPLDGRACSAGPAPRAWCRR